MLIETINFKGHRCFKDDWSGFSELKPLNVIIGRNNSGKSQLLDLVEAMCVNKLARPDWTVRCTGTLSEQFLKVAFPEGRRGGVLGAHWHEHGQYLVGAHISWEITQAQTVGKVTFSDSQQLGCGMQINQVYEHRCEARIAAIQGELASAYTTITGKHLQRITAERNIQPEAADVGLDLSPDGKGATNIIRRYLNTSDSRYPREIIQRDLLSALNQVFGPDAEFNELITRHHDDKPPPGISKDTWEVFLGEKKKGPVALSLSGSGLKTVILVLLHLLVVPRMKGHRPSECVFAFEELENSLHPALLRRLFQFIQDFALKENATVFVTTHSSTALDFFGLSPHAQLIHVVHDGKSAKASTISAHFDKLGVISELGAKPSDLLQANGIIWVEGPSDCIYINRWLDVFSGGRLQEGRDYQCAFYGGSLLARTQFKSPEDAEAELINLFRINPHIIVVCDGDRAAKGARVKDRVRRIRAEVRKIPGAHIWVTGAREIENYIPGGVLAKALELVSLPDPGQYELFFPRKGSSGRSYVEARMHRKGMDKMDLAVLSAPLMDKAIMSRRFDWEDQMKQIVERIDSWSR